MGQPSFFDQKQFPALPKFELRDYQAKCVEKVKWALQFNNNDLLVLPTGSGKSLVIASLAEAVNRKIIIFQPTKELLIQNHEKLRQYIPDEHIGIFSASMNRKVPNTYTLATIGSIVNYPELFQDIGLVIIDECDLVNIKKENSMYMQFLKNINNPKVIGLTASPYRLDKCCRKSKGLYGENLLTCSVGTKMINRMQPMFWNRLLFNISHKELVDKGYLCPMKYESADLIQHEDIPVNDSKSDFNLTAYEEKIKPKYSHIVTKLREMMRLHKSILFFCSSTKQAQELCSASSDIQAVSAYVTAKTPAKERETIINKFKDQSIQICFNVGILTTGFDHPALDCIILNRPTRSIRLYYQICGRGSRLFPGKKFCRVIDFTNTVAQIGPIESIELVKVIDPDELPFNGRPVTAKWNLSTSTGLWHGKLLYQWVMELPKRNKPETESFDQEMPEPSDISDRLYRPIPKTNPDDFDSIFNVNDDLKSIFDARNNDMKF